MSCIGLIRDLELCLSVFTISTVRVVSTFRWQRSRRCSTKCWEGLQELIPEVQSWTVTGVSAHVQVGHVAGFCNSDHLARTTPSKLICHIPSIYCQDWRRQWLSHAVRLCLQI
mmetsp:Transcript_111520/g.346019  ORF Transcript_111520/g.346019 Transcript_111520/m.346019 type:complete len:113 (-) Transcript_111520:281-619(-)